MKTEFSSPEFMHAAFFIQHTRTRAFTQRISKLPSSISLQFLVPLLPLGVVVCLRRKPT